MFRAARLADLVFGRVEGAHARGLNWSPRGAVGAQFAGQRRGIVASDQGFTGHQLHRLGAPDGAVSAAQFQARTWPKNAMALSRKEWLWSPNGAEVWVTSDDAGRLNRRKPPCESISSAMMESPSATSRRRQSKRVKLSSPRTRNCTQPHSVANGS